MDDQKISVPPTLTTKKLAGQVLFVDLTRRLAAPSPDRSASRIGTYLTWDTYLTWERLWRFCAVPPGEGVFNDLEALG